MIKTPIYAIALLITLCLSGNSQAVDNQQQMRRVVIQVNENNEQVWKHALTLAENMQKNAGGKDAIDIEIVAMSPGIRMVGADSSTAGRVSKIAGAGVKVRACNNTMNAINWGPGDLAQGVEIVPFGALEIIDRQNEGWAYLKP